jgi:predicted regulator of Ras-like GTPase activity (Roadblock/LC7/MglB family)
MPRKKSVQIVPEEEEQVDWTPKIEQPTSFSDLRSALDKVKSRDGIIGYIVRGPTSASVDIKDPTKIIDYAGLSAEAMESSETLSETFELGAISNIVFEGKNVKMLLLKKGEQELTVFMDRSVDHNAIVRELS